MKSVGVFLFRSLGAGYSASNQLFRHTKIELLEFTLLGDQSQILARGESEDLSHFRKSLSSADIMRTAVFDLLNPKVLDAYYSLLTSEIQNNIVIVEGHFLGDLFYAAQELGAQGLSLVDLRQLRSGTHPCHLVMTGDRADGCDKSIRDLKSKGLTVTIVEELSPKFKDYFQIQK